MSNDKQASARKFKVSLGERDSKHLKEIASQLGMSESEVMRKGLQLMALYAQTHQDETGESGLILKQGDEDTKILVVA